MRYSWGVVVGSSPDADDITRALAALNRLKALGVKIAMDDFGTG